MGNTSLVYKNVLVFTSVDIWGVIHASFISSHAYSLHLCEKEKWQVWNTVQIWFVKPWVCATVALPSIATWWNKYTLATVCIRQRHFAHSSSCSWSVCKLHSPEKPQKGEVGWSVEKRHCRCAQNTWAVIKVLVSSIGWKKCVEGVKPMDERAGKTGLN